MLFIKVLNEAPSHQASLVFSRNLIRCLMNQLAVEDRYLHRLAVKAVKSIQSRVSGEPGFAAAAVNGLIGSTGSVNFDHITRTKTIEKIVTEAGPGSLKQIISLFERLIAVPGPTESQAAVSSRRLLSGLLLSIVKSRSSASGGFEPIMEDILFILVRFAYFGGQSSKTEQQSAPEPPFTQATQQLFQSRIVSCLNSTISASQDPCSLCYAVVRKIRDNAKSLEFGKFTIDMDERIYESVQRAFKSLRKLSSKVSFHL
jgi:DNA polymerase phi